MYLIILLWIGLILMYNIINAVDNNKPIDAIIFIISLICYILFVLKYLGY